MNDINKLREMIRYYDNNYQIDKLREVIKYYDDEFLKPENDNEETKRHIILSKRLVQLDLMLMLARFENRQTTQLYELYLRETKKALTELLEIVETLLEKNLINEGVYLKMNNSLKVKYEMTEEIEKTGECNFCMVRIN